MTAKQTILDVSDLGGKRVLVRVDFNVPLDKSGTITDKTRIIEALPTIQYLLEHKACVVLASHLGRPKGEVVESMRMTPVVKALEELLPNVTIHAPDPQGQSVVNERIALLSQQLNEGEILVLENLRFDPGETTNDSTFAKQLGLLADVYVNDAFGAAHRAHASTEGVTHHVDTCVAGLLMDREIQALGRICSEPEHPFTALIGGSKVSSKITVLKNLLPKVDNLIIGGAMMFTFLKAQGYGVGNSLVEDEYLDTAREFLEEAKHSNTYIKIPRHIVIADAFSADATIKTMSIEEGDIPEGWMGLDIAVNSLDIFKQLIQNSRTVLWNGPVGVFELEPFAVGTRAIAEQIASWTEGQHCQSVLGGGDTLAAIAAFGIDKTRYSHVSTGGGASLEFLEGKILPGLAALDDTVAATV